MSFPIKRIRRLRRTETLRRMVRETRLSRDDLVLPLFVVEERGVREPVASMPGVLRYSIDSSVVEAKRIADLGIPAVILFGVPDQKDARGSGADAPTASCSARSRRSSARRRSSCVITDVCLCEYTDHGHCGIVRRRATSRTTPRSSASRRRRSRTRAPAPHVVAPSDMMDGRVARSAPRSTTHGFEDVAILAYAAKFASAYYGPFREAAESAPRFGDRRTLPDGSAQSTRGAARDARSTSRRAPTC